jgi:hypothetical protein
MDFLIKYSEKKKKKVLTRVAKDQGELFFKDHKGYSRKEYGR